MKVLMPIGAVAVALTVTLNAQDSKVTSRTEVKADDAKVIMMTGCLYRDAATGSYSLMGTVAAGDELKSKSTVKTDVDDDAVTVTGKTTTKAEDGAVATSGTTSTFALIPRSDVNLASHVGHQVQLSAVVVEAGQGDADVTVKERTQVDPENAPDTTARTKSKIEVPKSEAGAYSVVAVKPLSGACPAK